jgi:hypothetical protein
VAPVDCPNQADGARGTRCEPEVRLWEVEMIIDGSSETLPEVPVEGELQNRPEFRDFLRF